jgi:hypothetical protein
MPATSGMAKPEVKQKREGRKMYVASKLPQDLECQLQKRDTVIEPDRVHTTKEVPRWVKYGQVVVIQGTGYPAMPTQRFQDLKPAPRKMMGYSINTDIDNEFWKRWVEQNLLYRKDKEDKETDEVDVERSFAPLASRLILWDETLEGLKKKMNSLQTKTGGVHSGLDPLNPENDPRMPRSFNANVTPPTQADEMADRGPLKRTG